MAPGTPSRSIIMALGTLFVLTWLQGRTRKRLAAYLQRQAHKEENADLFLRGCDAVWLLVKTVLVLIAASGSFRLLGLTVGFLGTMLGWSLQVPIRGLAAWAMVLLKKPFRVGDRITVAGVTGDVTDIQLNHIVLNQVGGTVQGEERSGRGILVPNAILFNESILNYNYFGKEAEETGVAASRYMLDEVLVRLQFGSDQEFARVLCVDVARDAVSSLIGTTDRPPFIRSELLPWGVLLRVRYESIAPKRQEISSRVTESIWKAFLAHPDKVQFAFPGNVVGVIRNSKHAPPPMASSVVPSV